MNGPGPRSLRLLPRHQVICHISHVFAECCLYRELVAAAKASGDVQGFTLLYTDTTLLLGVGWGVYLPLGYSLGCRCSFLIRDLRLGAAGVMCAHGSAPSLVHVP